MYEEEFIEQPQPNKKTARRIIGDVLTVLLLLLCIFLIFTKFFWLSCVEVDGSSMESTLQHGDLLLIDNLAKPERGDVIVFTLHEDTKKEKAYIKRVVATEGDTVLIENGNLYVKQKGMEKFELIVYPTTEGNTYYDWDETATYEWVVSEGHLFVLGDNRENSTDSRALGEIDINCVNGVVHQFIIDNKDGFLGKIYKYL